MGGLYRPRRLRDPRVVPTEPVEVDWSHPLAFGLAGLWTGATSILDITDVQPPGTLTSTTVVESAVGPSYSVTTAPSLTIPNASTGFDIDPFSVWAIIQNVSTGTVVTKDDNNGSHGWDFGVYSGAVHFVTVGSNGNGRVSGGPLGSGTNIIGATTDTLLSATTNVALYLNGSNVTTTAAGSSGHLSDIGYNLRLIGTTDGSFSGMVATFGIATRQYSADEMAWLAAEPFAMLRPLR